MDIKPICLFNFLFKSAGTTPPTMHYCSIAEPLHRVIDSPNSDSYTQPY